uniref:Uncharacterized protein n=1 Tax=Kalanchoe fedtschenkoi TaxID=63787 RepID=A0A7N1A4R0_KALFE
MIRDILRFLFALFLAASFSFLLALRVGSATAITFSCCFLLSLFALRSFLIRLYTSTWCWMPSASRRL